MCVCVVAGGGGGGERSNELECRGVTGVRFICLFVVVVAVVVLSF